jgi:hypothetical protein
MSRGSEIKPPMSSILAELMLEAISPMGPGWTELASWSFWWERTVGTIFPRASLMGSCGVGAARATAAKRAVKIVEKCMIVDLIVVNVALNCVNERLEVKIRCLEYAYMHEHLAGLYILNYIA